MRVLTTGWDLKASLSNSNCTTDLEAIGTRFDDSSDHNVNPAAQRVGAATIQKCSRGENMDTGYLVLTFAQASPPKNLEFGNKGDAIMLPMGAFELNATVLFCQPTSKLEKAMVTTDSFDSILDMVTGNTTSPLGISSWDMALAFNTSVLDAAKSMSRTGDMYAYDTFFRILQAISPQDPVKYMDAQVLEAESRRLFAAVWAQIANQHLLMSSSQQIRGVYRVNELRLLLRPVTSYVLEAGIATILVCTVVMLFIRPIVVDLPDIPSLGRVAAKLVRSKEMRSTLKHTGAYDTKDLNRLLSGQKYTLVPELDGGSEVAIRGLRSYHTPPLPNRPISWWRPMALSAWMQILLPILPLAVIATLEITYNLSEKHHGLSDVTMNGYVHYTWTVIPAIILTTIKLLGQSLAFAVGVLDPYLALKAGASTAKQTLFHDYPSQTSLLRCFSSTRLSRWAVLSVSMSTLFSPFLTIVVSGLFDEQPVPIYQELNTHAVEQLTNFTARSFRGDDRPASLDCSLDVWEQATLNAANLLVQQVIPYPGGTFDNYIYPNVTDLSGNANVSKSFNASSISMTTSGYRPHTVSQTLLLV